MGVYILLGLSTIAATILTVRTLQMLRRHALPLMTTLAPQPSDLPTVTVCLAARNETHALAQCLERILASDYAKLEILVLDDSSEDDTSLIIKSFASAGVRFIPGKSLPDGWLGKNHAYQTLIDEASGDYLLFIDIDTTIRPATISHLVRLIRSLNISMLSVLPRREDAHHASAIFGTMRYYWELLLGTRISPPAASAIWMVKTEDVTTEGIGLSNYATSVRPERHMARQFTRLGRYRYVVGDHSLGIGYEKHLHSQYETAWRLYYPMTGRTFLNWFGASTYLLLLIAPSIILLSLPIGFTLAWALGLVILIGATFGLFVRQTYTSLAWQLRIALGPILVVQEGALLLTSYYQYRRGTVTWKGRRVLAQPRRHDALKINE